MYVYEEFPKMMYHPTEEPVVVNDYDAQKKLGADWFETQTEANAKLKSVQAALAAATAKIQVNSEQHHDGK